MPRNISEKLAQQRADIAADVVKMEDRVAVSRKWNCSISYVDHCCVQHGLGKTRVTNQEVVHVCALVLQGLPRAEIAQRVGINEGSVIAIAAQMRKHGMYKRGPGRPKLPDGVKGKYTKRKAPDVLEM